MQKTIVYKPAITINISETKETDGLIRATAFVRHEVDGKTFDSQGIHLSHTDWVELLKQNPDDLARIISSEMISGLDLAVRVVLDKKQSEEVPF